MATDNNPDYDRVNNIYEFTVRNIKGERVKLNVYTGHVCIIVNVASKCSFAKNNYKQLNEIYEKLGESKGLRILAFPCNQFGESEPGNSEEIESNAREHNVKFDMFQKIDVNGENAHPLWKFLKAKHAEEAKSKDKKGNIIKWNFTKFIINKSGIPVQRYGPDTDESQLMKATESYF